MRIVVLIAFLGLSLSASAGKYEKVTIQTSAICEMCKDALESAFEDKEGIVYSNLNLQNKKIKVKYDPELITETQIKEIISKTGYDADDMKADKEAYSNLAKCCQKDGECK